MIQYNPYELDRHSIRLKEFDYSSEALFFVTVVVNMKLPLFGRICNDEMILNDAGKMIADTFEKIESNFQNVYCLDYVVMPNHFHGIIQNKSDGAVSLISVMKWFKGVTTHLYIEGVKIKQWMPFNRKLWQTRYYDRILWNEQDYRFCADYIHMNPINWPNDDCNILDFK